MNHAIQVNNLHKRFGELQAVKGISFEVEQGEIFSLLGPNGAGKSTIISMLSGLLQPDEGDARIMGHSIRSEGDAARACLGVVPQDIALYPDLTARENLFFWGKMYGLRGEAVEEARRRGAGYHRPGRPAKRSRQQVFRRDEAAGQHRRGTAAQAAGGHYG